jgi:hypothetical protein
MWFFLNIYLQSTLGYDAFESGLALLPMTLAIMVLMMMVTEKVVGRIGPKVALMPADGTGTYLADVLAPSLLAALGMSLAYIPAMITATAGACAEDGGLASGLVNTTYQVGSAIGLAAMVAVGMTAGATAAFIGAGAIAATAAALSGIAIRAPRTEAAPQVATATSS